MTWLIVLALVLAAYFAWLTLGYLRATNLYNASTKAYSLAIECLRADDARGAERARLVAEDYGERADRAAALVARFDPIEWWSSS